MKDGYVQQKDTPVVRKQPPTWDQAIRDATMKGRQEALDFLFSRGYMGALQDLSIDTYGYGMEDTDDVRAWEQVQIDQAAAEDYLRNRL